jgi:glycosyltransferase involved in cell wall biosynthesis
MRWLRVAVNAEQLLYRSPGGIGRYTAQLLTVLPAFEPECEMVPVTARHPRSEVEQALTAVGAGAAAGRAVILPLPRPVLYESWVRLGAPPLRVPADLVHAPSVAVPPRGRRPLVVSVHDAASERFPETFPPRGRRWHRAGLLAAARRADAVITGSQAAAGEIAHYGHIPEAKIEVVPYCVEPPPEAGRPAGLPEGPYVLWIGSREPRKGLGTLVAAMARLATRNLDVATVVAGYEGWLGDGLVEPADVDTLGPKLVQLGQVSDEQLWALYRGATVFAFPSRHEGFGLPIIEAMSQGTAVVASDIEAVREVAGGAAVLVPPDQPDAWAEAIGALLSDEDRRRQLGAEGRARASRFTPEAMAAGTLAVYRRVGSS